MNFRRGRLGEIPNQGPYATDLPDFTQVSVAGQDEIVKALETRYILIPPTRTEELPPENYYQFKCKKLLQTGAINQPQFVPAPAEALFFTYIVPAGRNVLIRTINFGMKLELVSDQIASFLIHINGFQSPEYSATFSSAAFAGLLSYNLLLKPLDKFEVFFNLATTGYTFPGDYAFFQIEGWEFNATELTS